MRVIRIGKHRMEIEGTREELKALRHLLFENVIVRAVTVAEVFNEHVCTTCKQPASQCVCPAPQDYVICCT